MGFGALSCTLAGTFYNMEGGRGFLGVGIVHHIYTTVWGVGRESQRGLYVCTTRMAMGKSFFEVHGHLYGHWKCHWGYVNAGTQFIFNTIGVCRWFVGFALVGHFAWGGYSNGFTIGAFGYQFGALTRVPRLIAIAFFIYFGRAY